MAADVRARPGAEQDPAHEGALVRIAIGFTAWAERWFPDAFIFVAIAVVVVSLAALVNGATPLALSRAFLSIRLNTGPISKTGTNCIAPVT